MAEPAPQPPVRAAEPDAPPAPPADDRHPKEIGEFIERFAGLLYEAGVPRMPARVFVTLLTTDADRLTAADIGARLGVSPAAVSGAVRYLIQVGLVIGSGEPGSRRLYYSVPPNVFQHLLTQRNQIMTRWASLMRDGAVLLGPGSPAGQRVSQSAEYFEFVASVLPQVLAQWHEYKARRGGRDD
jgi:DNA-binding transcriptional regulator GbsR (MarR family)